MSSHQKLGGTEMAGVNRAPEAFAEGGNGSAVELEPGSAAPENAEVESLAPEFIAELKRKAARADENWDKFIRLSADLENFKKRAARERSEAVKYANESLIEKLLPIVDNFEAALAAAQASPAAQNASMDSLKMGIGMIHSQLKSFLADSGAEEIDALHKPFDPNLHEAVSELPVTDGPEGHVIQQMRKGYRFRERLVRPAMVVVSKKA